MTSDERIVSLEQRSERLVRLFASVADSMQMINDRVDILKARVADLETAIAKLRDEPDLSAETDKIIRELMAKS